MPSRLPTPFPRRERTTRPSPLAPGSLASAAGILLALVAAAASAGPPYQLYYGDLHGHTAYTDGTGTPWDAYAAARAAGADFFAVTDHDGYGFYLSEEEWEDTKAAADASTSRDFVGIAGYEFWLAGSGEINVFGVADLPPLPEDPEAHPAPGGRGSPAEVLPAFYDWLTVQPGAVGQWNHPTYVSAEFFDFDFHDASRDAAMSLIEVWNDSWFYTEDSYVKALDRGWHVMPTANADTHAADWIAGSPNRTVLLARRLTRADLLGAMRAGRGYATIDPNLRIGFTVNGAAMGETLAPSSRYVAAIEVEEPDGVNPIATLEIVADGGREVASVVVNASAVTWQVTLPPDARYFFLRVTTSSDLSGGSLTDIAGDGVMAVTAPVWTGR